MNFSLEQRHARRQDFSNPLTLLSRHIKSGCECSYSLDEKIAAAHKVKVGQRDWSTDVAVTEVTCNITVAIGCLLRSAADFSIPLKKKMIGAADLQRTDPVFASVIDLNPTQQQRDTLAKKIE
ncbi:TPA: hypothetical protein HH295_17650 [Xanthomonas vasicola pv. zeae]|uniref:hypothetical protein n=1 Tax=Xanthomonas vasicola TaxID=56459 RepID=UPI0003457CD7|nr:hypothetical protein [Xanthomonas vasicola]AZR27597.1 hypothetical protein NX80_015275 [Xanthomonas vasicola pv. arecae]AZR31799.1 hypothetical protein KWO_015975 [Xanthomonas vasicola pv. musacearum NCPPB 4379]AZR35826.1 hypothetical protein NX08_016620 [Xanthomonas vasicola]MBV6744466.1 hypothetical protein [Xanthomonas vasicola pv. musacearum NCPPB 2251]MBV6747795.1 hypothetical protein [Xanthomonas vasicola pv. vasculorum NCPPB 890]